MQDKDFDRLFKERFEAFEVEPAGSVWQNINKELDTPVQRKKKTLTSYWMAAASVMLLTSAVLWLNKPVEVIKLQGKSQGQMANQTRRVEAAKPFELKIIEQPATKAIISAQPERGRYVASRKVDKSEVRQLNKTTLAEKVSPQAPVMQEVGLATQHANIDLPKQQKAGMNEGNEVVVASVDENKGEDYREAETTNPRIRSVGGLVNFVIAQVDKRDDKIIEFRDGEEGSTVSGINIGPLKFKSRNK